MIIHLETDKLNSEVKRTLGSITTNKTRQSDEIPAELFNILKYNSIKVLHSVCHQIWKTQHWSQDWKRSVFITIPKNSNAKKSTVMLISHTSKVKLKILQAGIHVCRNQKLPDVQGRVNAEEPEIKLPTLLES